MQNNSSLQALIIGLKDGGANYAASYPGGPSHAVFKELGGEEISLNERVALESAIGASLAGCRSLVSFKGVGLNASADVFLHSVLNGVNGGIVLVLFDDIEAQSSPERQDSRPYLDFFGGLWLEPASIDEAYEFGRAAFEWSEELDVPVVIRITNQFLGLSGEYHRLPAVKSNNQLSHDRKKYISYWKKRNDNLKAKNRRIKDFVDNYYGQAIISKKSATGIVRLGNCQRESRKHEVIPADVLELSMYPLPEDLVRKFSAGRKKLIVLEQGNGYAAEKIRSLLDGCGEFISDTGDELDRSETWKIYSEWEKLFSALKSISPSYVVGDEGTFTDETTESIEFCHCMGSSVGVAMGLALAGVDFPFAVSGDASFQFAGKQTLIEAVHRQARFGIIILDNGGAHSVGGMPVIGDIYDIGDIRSVTVDYDRVGPDEFRQILQKMREDNKLAILYVRKKFNG